MNWLASDRCSGFRSSSGFSLTELLAVVLVGGALLTALTSFYLSEQQAFRAQQVQVETSQALRVALEQMVRDLRAAGRDPLAVGGIGITYADTSRIEFTLDADGNGSVSSSDPGETKGFRRNGATLETFVPGSGGVTSWQPLAQFIASTGTIFRYFRGDGTEITALPANATDRGAIRRVDIELRVTNRVPSAPDIDRIEAASVQLRNRG